MFGARPGCPPSRGKRGEGLGVQMSDRRIVVAAVLAAGATLAACSQDSGVHVQTLPTATPTVAVSSSPTPFPEETQILAQYRAFFAVLTPASKAKPAVRLAMLKTYATEPSLTRTLGGLAAAAAAGEVLYGQDILRPELVNVVGIVATIRDCQDTSGVGRLKVATGKKVTVGVMNTLATVVMKRGNDGVWRVSTVENKPAGSCSAAA
jgi:lambda repressor-like predicted transcriptional regulator